jgi:hypothetical protein
MQTSSIKQWGRDIMIVNGVVMYVANSKAEAYSLRNYEAVRFDKGSGEGIVLQTRLCGASSRDCLSLRVQISRTWTFCLSRIWTILDLRKIGATKIGCW